MVYITLHAWLDKQAISHQVCCMENWGVLSNTYYGLLNKIHSPPNSNVAIQGNYSIEACDSKWSGVWTYTLGGIIALSLQTHHMLITFCELLCSATSWQWPNGELYLPGCINTGPVSSTVKSFILLFAVDKWGVPMIHLLYYSYMRGTLPIHFRLITGWRSNICSG